MDLSGSVLSLAVLPKGDCGAEWLNFADEGLLSLCAIPAPTLSHVVRRACGEAVPSPANDAELRGICDRTFLRKSRLRNRSLALGKLRGLETAEGSFHSLPCKDPAGKCLKSSKCCSCALLVRSWHAGTMGRPWSARTRTMLVASSRESMSSASARSGFHETVWIVFRAVPLFPATLILCWLGVAGSADFRGGSGGSRDGPARLQGLASFGPSGNLRTLSPHRRGAWDLASEL